MRDLTSDLAHVSGVLGSCEFAPVHTNPMFCVWLRSPWPHRPGEEYNGLVTR
jgi:hypothetical protein